MSTNVFLFLSECLDSSARKPFYMCAPNDVWSLGVILVNLTCGRNPWKQASFQDSTYRAYARSQDFLKTILPVANELSDILGRIFDPCPELRITLYELRERIMACPRLTASSISTTAPSTPPVTPDHIAPYVAPPEEAIVDDYECDSPLSPVSTISDDGSLTSSGSTISDLDEDFIQEQQQGDIPFDYVPQTFEPEIPREHNMLAAQEFVPQQYTGPVPVSMAPPQIPQQSMQCAPQPIQAPIPVQPPCSKPYFPLWDVVRYVQQVPFRQPHTPFHPQAQVIPAFQGCF